MKGSSKRKRTREEIEEVKQEEEELKHDRQGYLQQIKRLKEEKDRLEEIVLLSQAESIMKSGNSSAQASKSAHNVFQI
jgi:predicted nuclease with TOPRIM domain